MASKPTNFRTFAQKNMNTILRLLPGKEKPLLRFHPWVFSGAVANAPKDIADGALVCIQDDKGAFLAWAHYQKGGSIIAKVISFEDVAIDLKFWEQKLNTALELRKRLNLWKNPKQTLCRLVHAEGDGLPGLVIDLYDRVAVLQAHSLAIHQERQVIATALQNVLGKDFLQAIYHKPAQEAFGKGEYLYQSVQEPAKVALENALSFHIDWEKGQKTGFFIDQSENRKLLAQYAQGKKVLNTFCYSGGFSLYALQAGASEVHSIDSSASAIALLEKNLLLNAQSINTAAHKSFTQDVMKHLAETTEMYDIIILDPPAFAKHLSAQHKAVQAYKKLNAQALQKIKPGGFLFTFSCSQVVNTPLFVGAVRAAAIESGRKVQILHELRQSPDHPVNIFHEESAYLKGLVLRVL